MTTLTPATLRDVRLVTALMLLLAAVLFAALQTRGDEITKGPGTPYGIRVSPQGEGVPRTAPVRVTFRAPTQEKDGSKLMTIEPPVQGLYLWQGDRTLVFQPAFPGMLRGQDYVVRVHADGANQRYQPFSFRFTTGDALNVTSVIPSPGDVEVPANSQVMVQFSRSVALLTTLAEQPDAPVIVFEPPLPGKGEWLNTSLYRFTPAPGALAVHRTYRARIPAQLTGEPDGALPDDYVWSFTTANPAVARVTPDNNTKFAAPFEPVAVTFTQPMSRVSVEAGLRVNGPDGVPASGSFAWSDDGTSVKFVPALEYAPSARYKVVVPAGVSGATGGATQTEWRSVFEVVPLPRVVSTMPRDGEANAGRYGIQIQFNVPLDDDTFEGLVSVSGIDGDKLTVNAGGASSSAIFIGASLEASKQYTVTLAEGGRDRYGRPVGSYSFSFTTGARPRSLSLAVPAQVATYAASAEPLLYFHATNMQHADFRLYPLTEAEITEMQRRGVVDDPRTPFVPSQPMLHSWREQTDGLRDQVLLKSTSLSRTGRPLPKGDYLVEVTPSGQNFSPNVHYPGYGTKMAFSVVDAAVVTKVSHDELLIWALDYDTGRPLPNQRLAVSGSATATVTTNAEGLATVHAPRSPTAVAQAEPRFLVKLEGSAYKGVASTAWNRGAHVYNYGPDLGVYPELHPRKYVGTINTDRPIYRPGEEVPYKAVVRLDDDAAYHVPAEAPDLFIQISDPKGKQMAEVPVAVNEFGSFAGVFTVPHESSTGDYRVSLIWKPAPQFWHSIGGTAFTVAEFRKPEFQVTAETPSTHYVAGDTVQAQAEATYYFGGPVEGATVNWATLAEPYAPRFKGFERYSFLNPDPDRTSIVDQRLRSEGTAQLDARGIAAFSFPATLSGNEGPQRFTIGASVTDESAQLVGGYTAVTVHPASLYAGVRTASYTAQAGREATIEVATVDLEGRPLPRRDIAVKVYSRTYVTSKEQTPEGGRRYVSTPRDTLLTTLNARTGDDAKGTVIYTPATSGSLYLVAEVTDERGRVARSSTFLYVSGREYVNWRVSNDDSMKLIADREQYQVGDTAEILVPAPFVGATGLVTIERGKIIERYVRHFETNSERIAVPITDRSLPNVYVSVVLYKPPTADDPLARYKVGYVQLPVSTDSRVLNVSVRPDREQTRPGETVRYDVKVTDWRGRGVEAEVSVAVVDKALLALADEKGLNGLKAFWFQRGLGVTTASSLAVSVNRANDVIMEPSAGGKGGGGDDERLRQDFRNSAFWEAQLRTDGAGNASFDVPMPDNLTTWHTQVRAISGNILVGEGTNELISAQPLLLRPALPRFFRVGDKPTLRTLLRNSTRAPQDVTVTPAVEGLTLLDAAAKTLRLEPGATAVFEWPAAVEEEGRATVTFTAKAPNGLGDAVRHEMPVYIDITQETTATGGVVGRRPATETVFVPSYVTPKQGSLTVSVEASLLKALGPQLSDFEPQVYEGADRIASRVVANLAVQKADPSVRTRSLDQLRSDVAALLTFQRGDGGFVWCSRCTTSDPGITAWALIALGEWRRAGHQVEAGVLSRASAYLNDYTNRFRDVQKPADANAQAFFLYARSISSPHGVEPSVRSLFNLYRAQLTNSGRAYLLLAMAEAGLTKKDPQVRTILADVAAAAIPSANGNHWENARIYDTQQSSPRTTALVLGALVRLDPEHALIEETVRWLRIGLSTGTVRTTLERADTLKALAEYATYTGELDAEYGYDVWLDGLQVMEGRLASGAPRQDKRLALKPGTLQLLQLERDYGERGRMYYTMDLRYQQPAEHIEALNRGITVSREYSLVSDPGARRITSARLGDNVRVKVTVLVPADRNYVVVEDLLPAGLEAIDPKLKTTDVKLKAQLDKDRGVKPPPRRPLFGCAPWFDFHYSPWSQVDLRDDRVVLQGERVEKGLWEYVYYARATTPGDFLVPPVRAEESFFPEVFGRSDGARFSVTP